MSNSKRLATNLTPINLKEWCGDKTPSSTTTLLLTTHRHEASGSPDRRTYGDRHLLPREDESYPCAEPVRVLSVAIATVGDPEIARLSSRVLTLSALLCVCDLVTFIYSAILDHNYGFAALAALMLRLLLPVCGLRVYGKGQPDDNVLLGIQLHLLHRARRGGGHPHRVDLAGFKNSILYPLIGNCIVSCMLYLSFIWGKDLHSKAYWDQGTYGPEDDEEYDQSGTACSLANARPTLRKCRRPLCWGSQSCEKTTMPP